jgi:predicted protein tyrosine phosphatase
MAAAQIHVCSLEVMPQTVAVTQASHLISLINSDMMPTTPDELDSEQHLKLVMNDIGGPMQGRVATTLEHIERLISFIDGWDQQAPLVIHCWAGISRSTAAALITLCHFNPDRPERDIAWMIRSKSPTASPNRLLIENADKALSREGRLIAAVKSLGPADISTRGVAFSATVNFEQSPERSGRN